MFYTDFFAIKALRLVVFC